MAIGGCVRQSKASSSDTGVAHDASDVGSELLSTLNRGEA